MKTLSLTAMALTAAFAFTACDSTSTKTDTESDATATDTDSTASDTEDCFEVETADTSDPCYEYTGPTILQTIDWPDCDTSTFTYDGIETIGWTSGENYLYIRQTGNVTDVSSGWGEDHTVGTDSFLPDNRGEFLIATLTQTDDYTAVEDGVTLYDCADERIEGLTFWLEVTDLDGNIADCGVWGHDTSYSGSQLGASTSVPSGCYDFGSL